MKRKFNIKQKSFLRTCVFHFTIFSLLLLTFFIGFMLVYTYILDKSFSDMDNMMKYKTEMKEDRYMDIPINSYKNCAFIVFDEENKQLYASKKSLSGDIKSTDLWLIEKHDSDMYYIITQYTSGKYNGGYYIQKCRTRNDGTMESLNYAIVDFDYTIKEGTLFSVDKLTSYEFNLLSGKVIDSEKNEFSVSKYEYKNNKGAKRTFVLVYPTFREDIYYEQLNEVYRFIPIPVFLVILLIVLQTFMFDRSIKKSLNPLNNAMLSYEKGEPQEVDKKKLPVEFFDIAENFERLMNQLAITEGEKEKANQERQRMIVDLSHDLKTPLTVISGYAKALSDHMVPSEKEDYYLQTIYSKARQSSKMIDTLFVYARMEHPEYTLHTVQVDINEWLEAYVDSRKEEVELKGFEIETQIPEEIEVMKIDLTLFTRAMDNLLNNTLKYNPVGTHILYKVMIKEDAVEIIYADNGVGISKEIGERIFDAFVTTNEARTSGKGTGLGMSIVKRIIELHGGTIEMSQYEGYQTVFKIILKRENQ